MNHPFMATRHPFRALAFAALFFGGSILSGAGDAGAAEAGSANTPPPMPEAMQQMAAPPVPLLYAAPTGPAHTARLDGKDITIRRDLGGDVGFTLPDASGGLLQVPVPQKSVPPGYTDARELKLKIRELASQLLADMDPSLRGVVALPTSFVSQDDFSQTSPLGRFISEQFFYECNQRNFPVREYRMAQSVSVREDGEFLLSRKNKNISTQTKGLVFVVGTYFMDRQAVFINARLVRGDGTVLRTAQVILPPSIVSRRMVAGGGKRLKTGSIPIRDFQNTTQPTNLTPYDRGEDVH